MSWRRRLGGIVGVGALTFATAAVVAPEQVLGRLPPTVTRPLTRQPARPAIAASLAVYAGWMILSRGWLSPVRETSATPSDARRRGDAGEASPSFERISGVTPRKADKLRAAGYESVDDLKTASGAELADVVGTALSARIKTEVEDLDGPETAGEAEPNAGSRVVPIRPDEFEALRAGPPEEARAATGSIVGSEFETTLREAARAYRNREDRLGVFDRDPDESDADSDESDAAVRRRLIALRTASEQSEDGAADADVVDRAADGAVRSFLRPEHSEDLPLRYRLGAWLRPEKTFERLVDRSVETLEEAHSGSEDER